MVVSSVLELSNLRFLGLRWAPAPFHHCSAGWFVLLQVGHFAKNPGMSKMTAENSKERRNNGATRDRIQRKNIQLMSLRCLWLVNTKLIIPWILYSNSGILRILANRIRNPIFNKISSALGLLIQSIKITYFGYL